LSGTKAGLLAPQKAALLRVAGPPTARPAFGATLEEGLHVKNRVIVAAICFVVVFLVGFAPQYSKARRLENELRKMRLDYAGAELRDLAGLAYIQATQKNFGLAQDTVKQFFDRAGDVANQMTDAKGRKALEDLMTFRERVVAELAKADPSAVGDLQDLFMKSRQATAWRTEGQK